MKSVLFSIIFACLVFSQALAQTAALRGQITDETGSIVPGAKVLLGGPGGVSKTATSTPDGSYAFTDLPPGNYTLQASAPSMSLRQTARIALKPGAQTLNLSLTVASEKQELTIAETAGPTVSTEAVNNASAIVLTGADLDALSDNPDDLLADLQALAGPAAGPNGGSIFIDGFSGGELPPKNSIREIRINQNPFSPEYDKLGFGRIEIFTKPGTDKFRGSFGYNFADAFWNSRNAYSARKAPFRLNELSGSLSGPVNKRLSFNLSLMREMVDNGNVIHGITLDPKTLVAGPFSDTFVSSLGRTGVTPRVDYQLNATNTLSVRYSFSRDDVANAGVGGTNLTSRAYQNVASSQTLQMTESAVLSATVINETRFQYFRPTNDATANNPGYALNVLGAFNGGGAQVGHATDVQNTYEFQNYTSVLRGAHSVRFGARLRGATNANSAPQNFGGTFTFSGGLAAELNASNQPVLDASGKMVLVNISSIESYRRTLLFQQMNLSAAQIRQLGGGASQFTINAGNPLASAGQFDMGMFVGDDWRVRPNFTVNLGLRYETQTNIHDWRDIAPRIGFAWAPGKTSGKSKSKNVIRAGFGIFYDRFSLSNILTAQRYNGSVQKQYIVTNPDFFPTVPAVSALPGTVAPSTIQEISSSLRAPYLMQSAASFERQLPMNTTVAVTYANAHGLHLLRSQDINAPLPGTYNPTLAASGVFPFGRAGQVLLMESAGLYNQNQIIVNVNSKVNSNISLTLSYAYNRAFSNTDGLGTYPANPYNLSGEYGPASTDIRNRVALAGTITAKWGIRFNPLLTASSGPPFDITAGQDLYGDGLFNARPGIATNASKTGVVMTKYGLLDPNPTPQETLLTRNSGRGPGQIMLNMRVGRTFAFGPAREGGAPIPQSGGGGNGGGGAAGGGGGGAPGARNAPSSPFSMGGQQGGGSAGNHRYGLTISMQMRNLTNHNNPGTITGNITSPLFGMANQSAGSGNRIFSESANNRFLELQLRLTF